MFMDDRIGSIEPGKHADFVLLDKHPQRVPCEELRALRILGTWIDGRLVWRV
jgi:predicted amidohydrolase YtcJ